MKGMKGFVGILVCLMMVGLGYYLYLNNHVNDKVKENALEGPEQQLLNIDLDNDYPKTVRETVKYHCNYLKYAYNGKYSEDELYIVNQQIRKLMDEDLLALNDEATQLQGLKNDILDYKENKKIFVNFSLPEGSQVKTNVVDDVEYAKLTVSITLKIGANTSSGDEEYLLRKDAEGNWKIMGWQAVSKGASGAKEN